MKIVVTGADGQVGAEVVKRAKLLRFDVISCTRENVDITDVDQVRQFLIKASPDILINAAAYTAVDMAEKQEEAAFQANGVGVGNLSNIARKLGIPLLHLSTDYVFDGTKDSAYSEDDETNPINVYGHSKLLGENYLEQTGINYINIRTSWVFGLQGNNFVKTITEKGRCEKELSIVSDQIGGPTFAPDIAKVLLDIVIKTQENGFSGWGTYHYSGAPFVSWWEFGSYVLRSAFDKGILKSLPVVKKVSASDFNMPAKRPKNSRLSGLKIEEELGIPPSSWHCGVDELLDHMKKNRELHV